MESNINPIFATHGAVGKVKPDTYGFVSSTEIMDLIQSRGWELHNTQIGKARKYPGFQRHLLSFTHPVLSQVSGLRSEHNGKLTLNVLNSHDGNSALRFGIGFYRTVCANGIVLGTEFSAFRVIHSKRFTHNLMEKLDQVIGNFPKAISRIKTLQDITLTGDQYKTIASSAATERLKHLGPKVGLIDLDSVLRVERIEDRDRDAFTILNRIQEKLIRGGIGYRSMKLDPHASKFGMAGYVDAGYRTTRQLRSVNETVRLNQFLTDKVLEYVKAS